MKWEWSEFARIKERLPRLLNYIVSAINTFHSSPHVPKHSPSAATYPSTPCRSLFLSVSPSISSDMKAERQRKSDRVYWVAAENKKWTNRQRPKSKSSLLSYCSAGKRGPLLFTSKYHYFSYVNQRAFESTDTYLHNNSCQVFFFFFTFCNTKAA